MTIAAIPFDQLMSADPLGPVQRAIVAKLTALLPGVAIKAHPGKVDLSELIEKSVTSAPGIGVGFSRVRRSAIADGSFSAVVEWTAYIVAEAKVVAGRRVEKEDIGLAVGNRLLAILADDAAPFWELTGILPPEESPAPELRPLFTVRDASRGTAYYTVTWVQQVADIGQTHFPTGTARANPDNGTIDFDDPEALAAWKRFFPMEEVPEQDNPEDDDA